MSSLQPVVYVACRRGRWRSSIGKVRSICYIVLCVVVCCIVLCCCIVMYYSCTECPSLTLCLAQHSVLCNSPPSFHGSGRGHSSHEGHLPGVLPLQLTHTYIYNHRIKGNLAIYDRIVPYSCKLTVRSKFCMTDASNAMCGMVITRYIIASNYVMVCA